MGIGASCGWRSAGKIITLPCANFFSSRLISTSAAADNGKVDEETGQCGSSTKSLCTICLEPLNSASPSDDQTVFTSECAHTFHFTCIASNVRHGGVTCPICRAEWSTLPRHRLAAVAVPSVAAADPVLRILEDSIATSRVNRRSARPYDDDDPIEPLPTGASTVPRLSLAVVHTAPRLAHISVRLVRQTPTDLVLVVSLNGPHIRLVIQAISLVVFSLCPADRLAIVTHSAAGATRALPLLRMSTRGKQSALRIVDRLSYLGPAADPVEGIRKGAKILKDRAHQNPSCSILHLSDIPTDRNRDIEMQVPVPVHQFHVGIGSSFGESSEFVKHKFEEFLGRLIGGRIRDARVRIEPEGEWVRLGEVRGGEERRIPLHLTDESEFVCVRYNYVEGFDVSQDRLVSGEAMVGIKEKECDRYGERDVGSIGSGGERWDLDPFMARRWAKHLHRARKTHGLLESGEYHTIFTERSPIMLLSHLKKQNRLQRFVYR